MDSGIGYHRSSTLGWRVLVAVAAVSAAVGSMSSHHLVTALILIAVAILATADVYVAMTQQSGRVLAPSTDVGAMREADRLRALVDAVGTALFVLDAQGRIIMTNRAARSMAGANIARLDDVAALGPAAIAAIRQLPAGARRIVRSEDGRSLFAWSGSFTIPGEPPQLLLSLQWVASELDVVEIEAWHSMARVLTHEMMNSLTPIVSLAETLVALPDHPSQTARALATIARRATHLLHFVERYRVLGDLPQPNAIEFDLAVLLTDLVQAVEPELRNAGVDLSLRTPDSPAVITADPELLERALINLLRNAIEASQGEKEPLIEIDLPANRKGVTVRIRDYGAGIPPDRLDEIFVPFFSTKSGGSGIGLPLARQIATLHHGTLVAKPMIRGSCFELHLPNQSFAGQPIKGTASGSQWREN